jgi:hypothetical protein
MSDRKTCTIIGSNKGGVGKSMIALMQTTIYDNAGFPLRVVEIDNARKLSTLLGDRVNHSVDAFVKLAETARNRHAGQSHYNGVYTEMMKSDSLIDFGANVTDPFFEWFRNYDMGVDAAEDGIAFRFVACASPDEQAINAAVTSIETAREALGPNAEYFAVLNDLYGQSGFAPYAAHPDYLKLVELQKAGKVTVINVGYCDSLLFEHGKALNMTPVQIVNDADPASGEHVVATNAGLDPVAERVHRRSLLKWLQDTQVAMGPILKAYRYVPTQAVG